MNETEEHLHQTLLAFESQAPAVDGLADAAKRRARSHRQGMWATASGVLVAVATVGAVVLISPNDANSPTPASSATPATSPTPTTPVDNNDVSQLTGKAVGEALGLKSFSGFPDGGCQFFVQYANPMGYCLEGVETEDPVEQWLLARQIVGHPRTPALQQWVVLFLHRTVQPEDELLYEAAEKDLDKQVDAEKEARDANPDSPVVTTAPPLDSQTSPEVGKTYTYTMSIHCGVEWISINGEPWQAIDPLGNGNPPKDWADPQIGLLRLITPDEALYTDELGHLVFFTRQADTPAMVCK